MVLRSVQSVLSLVLLMGLGWLLAGQDWFGKRGGEIFSKLSVQICIPAYMCYTLLNTYGSREELLSLAGGIPIPMAAMLIGCAMALLLTRVFRVGRGRRGVFLNAVTLSNTVLVGFPIITSLFGEEAAPVGMVYYMANTLLFWTVGVYALRADAGDAPRFFSPENLRKILSPPLLGFFAGALLVLTEAELPYFLFDPIRRLGQCSTPIAMLFIGCLLRESDLRRIWGGREIWVILAVRFVFSPALMYGICRLLPLPALSRQVFFVMATMPAMTQLGIMAKETGCDAGFASAVVAGTTVVAMGMLPLYAALMQLLPF